MSISVFDVVEVKGKEEKGREEKGIPPSPLLKKQNGSYVGSSKRKGVMVMAWTPDEHAEFMQTLNSFWPFGVKEPQGQHRMIAVTRLYAERLEKWKLPIVLAALRNLKARGAEFLPEIPIIKAECRDESFDQEGKVDESGHPFVKRARELARSGAFRIDSKGRKWFFCRDALWCPDIGHGPLIKTKGGQTTRHAAVLYVELLNTTPSLGNLCDEARFPESFPHREETTREPGEEG